MKYIAIIDADEKPVSCEFIGCNGNVAPYLIGATDNIKALEQEPKADVLDKIKAEIEQMPSELTADGRRMIRRGSVFRIIDRYMAESEE